MITPPARSRKKLIEETFLLDANSWKSKKSSPRTVRPSLEMINARHLHTKRAL